MKTLRLVFLSCLTAWCLVMVGCNDPKAVPDAKPGGLRVKADELCKPCGANATACASGMACLALDSMKESPGVCAATCHTDDECGDLFPGRTGKCVQAKSGNDARLHPVAASSVAGSLPDDFLPCSGGTCVCTTTEGWCPHRCIAGKWESCNSQGIEDPDGCEQDLSSPQFCGHCDNSTDCTTLYPHAVGHCKNGAQCVLSPEDCETGWADCDGLAHNGCETNLKSDDNCGACGTKCGVVDHAVTTCSSDLKCVYKTTVVGNSAFLKCDDNWADCKTRKECDGITDGTELQKCLQAIQPSLDGNAAGCETALGTMSNCDGCGKVCSNSPDKPHACVDNKCVASDCPVGYIRCGGQCKKMGQDTLCGGCDDNCTLGSKSEQGGKCCVQLMTPADPNAPPTTSDCYTLDQALADAGDDPVKQKEALDDVMCHAFTCKPGWANCDKSADGSCETNLNASVDHCGTCEGSCIDEASKWKHITSASCSQGTCSFGCEEGYTTCGTDSICLVKLGTVNHCKECGDKCKNGTICSKGSCQCPPDKVACTKNGVSVCQTPGVDFCEVCGDKCLQSNACSQGTDGSFHCKACAGASAYCIAGQSCVPTNVPERCGTCDNNCLAGSPKNVMTMADGTPEVKCDLNAGQYSCDYACKDGWADCDTSVSGCESSTSQWPNCGACHACDNVANVSAGAQVCQSGGGQAPCAAYLKAPANPETKQVTVDQTKVNVTWTSQCKYGYFDCDGGTNGSMNGCECRTSMTWDTPPAWLTDCSEACKNGQCSCDYSAIKKIVCEDQGDKCI